MQGVNDHTEWLETDGLGGFAMGTASGIRTRRYHALLIAASKPPADRVVLVRGFDAWIETDEGRWALSTQRYVGGHAAPNGSAYLSSFVDAPFPAWRYRLPGGLVIEHELFMRHGSQEVHLAWRLIGPARRAALIVRPILACTDMHALRCGDADVPPPLTIDGAARVQWRGRDRTQIFASSNGAYQHEPLSYTNLFYQEEAARGFDALEDAPSPGVFRWNLTESDALLVFGSPTSRVAAIEPDRTALVEYVRTARNAELARRDAFPSLLHRAADAYIVRREDGASTILAGYPWFGEWGRDTFIAMRGLCSESGRRAEAAQILLRWAGAVSQGMLPNRFTDVGQTPEFNSVDASLWFVIAAGEYLDACDGWNASGRGDQRRSIRDAILAIVSGYAASTRYGIRACADGLLAAGEPGQQLTWMDARADGHEVTPRIGKPVEVQALWINALSYAGRIDNRWTAMKQTALASFQRRFVRADSGSLFDVVDVDHVPGRVDPAIRPNQIFAVGGLPEALLTGDAARRVVDAVEHELVTPLGLRSLAPGQPGYRPRYEGGPSVRDGAYHQGTVWPWLMGPFVQAWLRVHGSTPNTRAIARRRFVEPLLAHLEEAGLGHVSEIADAEPPRRPSGCPFQAWSVGELLRMLSMCEVHGETAVRFDDRSFEAAIASGLESPREVTAV